MKCFVLAVVVGLVTTPVRADDPASFQPQKLAEKIELPDTVNRSYQLLVPNETTQQRFPLVIYLHGAGAKGGRQPKATRGEPAETPR